MPSNAEISALASPDLLSLALAWRERLELYQEQLFRERRYGRRSERSPAESATDNNTLAKGREDVTKPPSERYPDAPVHVEDIALSEAPPCPCCGAAMTDSGMTENSESIGVKEKQFFVIEQRRKKYRCTRRCDCDGTCACARNPWWDLCGRAHCRCHPVQVLRPHPHGALLQNGWPRWDARTPPAKPDSSDILSGGVYGSRLRAHQKRSARRDGGPCR